MNPEVKDLRDKQVVDFKEDEVQSIEITGGATPIVLAREGTDWKLTQPKALKADAAEIRSLLAAIKGVRAEDFVDEPEALGEYGLDPPRPEITPGFGKDSPSEPWR